MAYYKKYSDAVKFCRPGYTIRFCPKHNAYYSVAF